MPESRDEPRVMEVTTPLGVIRVTESIDPLNPGVYVELARPDRRAYALNLACVECQIPEDDESGETPRLVTHVWGDADAEDSTHDVAHANVDAYFA